MPACDVLITGDYYCDLVFTGLDEPPRLGAEAYSQALDIVPGGAYILAAAFHRLGVNACWLARLGTDIFSRFIREQALQDGLDSSLFMELDRSLRSVTAAFSFVHDRGFLSYMDEFPPAPLREAVAEQHPRWVYNLPFNGSLENLALADWIHQQGARIFVDCQYTTQTLGTPGLVDLLSRVDIFAPNQGEACQLTGEDDALRAAAALAAFCPLVIVKRGAQGALAQAGRQTWQAPALPVNVVDTTGAGDAFNAGFLAAHLRGHPLPVCLHAGNICGGLSTTQPGGAGGVPTWEQVLEYLQE